MEKNNTIYHVGGAMKYIEEVRKTPVVDSVDVLVLGSGPAGIGAALSAGRMGKKVLLVEQTNDVGGVATTGLMSHWTGNTRGGIYDEIVKRTTHLNGDRGEKHGLIHGMIDHEYMKTVLLELLEEAGVKIRLNTFACDALMQEKRVTGVVMESKSGREAVDAAVVIDATGDGDIAARAGAEFVLGREEDHKMQPVTLMLQVGGVDLDTVRYNHAFEDSYQVPAGDLQTLARKHMPAPMGHVLIYPAVFPGVVTLNMTNVINIDGTDADSITKGNMECRKQIRTVMEFLHEYVPGFENCYLMKTASQLGIRETRHFKGLYTLNENDIKEARVFDDWVVSRAHFNFDVHNISGAGLDETGCQKHFEQKRGYTIPYRCLVPEKIDGLLLAGRNISGTHMAHSNYRVMPICMNMGQAAGIAAALCVEKDVLPRDLDAKLIQSELEKLGVEL